MSNALANYWATSGATIDPRALSEQDLFLQDDKLVQKLYEEDGGPNLAYKDYVNFDRWEPDGDDDGWNYFRWSRK